MEHRIVSTEEFWDRSCHFAFVRLDKHRGAIGNTVYHVTTPPEDVPGFLEGKMGEVCEMLGRPKTGHLTRLLCWLGCHWFCAQVSIAKPWGELTEGDVVGGGTSGLSARVRRVRDDSMCVEWQ